MPPSKPYYAQEPAKQALIALVLSLVSSGAQCTTYAPSAVGLDWAAVGSGPCFRDHSRWLHGGQLTLSTRTCWHLERHLAAGGIECEMAFVRRLAESVNSTLTLSFLRSCVSAFNL